jgi:predicted lipoprotein
MNRAWLAASLVLSSCVPWTVRPIAKSGDTSNTDRTFDARAYVASIWDAKVLPTVAAQAVDLATLLRSPSDLPPAFLVKGAGRVLNVDTTSRTGFLSIDLAPYDGHADARVQIGPVLRGTALRDALPFIQFSQFVNQLEFARVGNALNDRVLATLPQQDLAGKVVSFAGAATRPAPGALPEIVPVQLTVTGAAR